MISEHEKILDEARSLLAWAKYEYGLAEDAIVRAREKLKAASDHAGLCQDAKDAAFERRAQTGLNAPSEGGT